MKTKIFFAASAVAMLLSCESKTEGLDNVADKQYADLQLTMLTDDTKASGEGDDGDAVVSSYQVLIYDSSNKMLEVYATPDPTSNTFTVQCTTGPKDIVVLANAPDVSHVVSYRDLLETHSYLTDNSIGNLVMEGKVSTTLSSLGTNVAVNLRRIVSKVVLTGINVDFENDAYDGMDFILKNVYMTNVSGSRTYLGYNGETEVWYNKNKRNDTNGEVDAMIYDKIDDVNLKDSKEYTAQHHFYAYPNPKTNDIFTKDWSPRPTRLVVEAELGGVLYYYPVLLPELNQNVKYYVSLNIVRPGATSPEQDMDKYAAEFTVEVDGWDGPEDVTETI